jgi:glycosyltransferase involved in cell wall biosynthesis
VPYYFAAADVVALPYVRIYQSGVLHLAYTFGRPVVATRVGGLTEDIKDGKSGVLVPPGDENALATALEEMLADPERLAAMGEHARMLAETVYSWDAIARRTLDFYESLLTADAA